MDEQEALIDVLKPKIMSKFFSQGGTALEAVYLQYSLHGADDDDLIVLALDETQIVVDTGIPQVRVFHPLGMLVSVDMSDDPIAGLLPKAVALFKNLHSNQSAAKFAHYVLNDQDDQMSIDINVELLAMFTDRLADIYFANPNDEEPTVKLTEKGKRVRDGLIGY